MIDDPGHVTCDLVVHSCSMQSTARGGVVQHATPATHYITAAKTADRMVSNPFPRKSILQHNYSSSFTDWQN